MGRAVLTAPSEVGVYAALFHLGKAGGDTAREKLSQEKLVRIDYLITNKHSACSFIIFMPTILTHIQCGEIAA